MLIGLRDKDGNVRIKDILDLNIDMSVEEIGDKFKVKVTRTYYLDDTFDTKEAAESAMYNIENVRNEMEQL
jgi:hypothetical protein